MIIFKDKANLIKLSGADSYNLPFDIIPTQKREDSRPPLGYCGLRRGLFSRGEASAL